MPSSAVIMASKRNRVMQALSYGPIASDSLMGKRYRIVLETLLKEGQAIWLNGEFHKVDHPVVNLHVGEVELASESVRGALFLEHFRAVARSIDQSRPDTDVILFRVNDSTPFPVHVETLRKLIAHEQESASQRAGSWVY